VDAMLFLKFPARRKKRVKYSEIVHVLQEVVSDTRRELVLDPLAGLHLGGGGDTWKSAIADLLSGLDSLPGGA
jgi:hypothetical protein